MVLITEELVRKRSEHNECVISTLEELSLHQEDIEKIDHLQNWCRDLRILLLQSNLICKIENLNKMKKLEYLNLALNNIEMIENLEGCESLQKLDLTLNFVGELVTIERLKVNSQLNDLYLSGNPCAEYEGYREFVIATLPQLKTLDNIEIDRSDRIRALQNYNLIKPVIEAEQIAYRKKREKQKNEAAEKEKLVNNVCSSTAEEDENFWKEMSENTPETRIELANHSRRAKQRAQEKKKECEKREIKLFKEDGQPNNINEAKIPFSFEEDEDINCFILTLGIYKYLDTSLVEVDVQPQYVTVRIKGKVFQMNLGEEVLVEKSTAQRSLTTGHLVITMPKMKGEVKVNIDKNKSVLPNNKYQRSSKSNWVSKREYLEIGKNDDDLDFSKIVEKNQTKAGQEMTTGMKVKEKMPAEDFQDNPEVPPLV